MKTSIIRQRVADFLQRHTPFDALSEQDLLDLAGGGKVKFCESDEYVFQQGTAKGQFLWVIQQGRVELLDNGASGERLRDVLGEGDLLGLEQCAGDGACLHSARTASDVILYGLPTALFESLVLRYPAVQRFVAARFSVSGAPGFNRNSWLDSGGPPMDFLRARLVTVPANASAADAALRVAESRNGAAALVDNAGIPAGIATVSDTCALPCAATAAAPVSTRSAVREMLRTRCEYVAITADGTPGSRLEAILTEQDLALFTGQRPVQLVRAIQRAETDVEIRLLLQRAVQLVLDGLGQPHDVDDCCLIGAEVVRALAGACIRMAERDVLSVGIEPPRVPYCWVMFGASARRDLTRPGVPTIAAVYDDTGPAASPEDSVFFTALAGEMGERFHAVGLAGQDTYWPDGAQPSMPFSEWKRLYTETIRNPIGHNLYERREFLDLRTLSGDASILEKLREHILFELRDYALAIPLLANDTMVRLPPLTLFRGLVLDLDGAQRDSFDIDGTVIAPLTDAARVFAMAKRRLTPVDTLERLAMAEQDFPQGAEILREAADAFRIGLFYRSLSGSSRIAAGKLAKFDQMLLKSAFSSIQRFLEFTVATFVPAE